MKARIVRVSTEPEYYFKEGCFITEIANSGDDPILSIARARVEPGVTTRWHRLHGVGERYFILQGEGLVEAGEMPSQRVVAGDLVVIPPGTPQRIHNSGSVELIFLALCTPRFTPECYEELETDSNPDTTV